MATNRKRRGRGEGAVYQHAATGLWCAQVSLGYRPNGTRIRKTIYGKTKAEALEKLRRLQARTGLDDGAERMTVAELFAMHVESAGWRESTAKRNQWTIDAHILPFVAGRVSALNPLRLQAWVDDLAKVGATASQRKYARVVMSGALERAVQFGILPANPIRGVRVQDDSNPKPRSRGRALDPKELRRLMQEARRLDCWAPLALMATAGVRIGELLALEWGDVDLGGGWFHVRATADPRGERRPPKTKRSDRRVNLADLQPAARAALAAQAEASMALGRTDRVFARPDGTQWRPDSWTQQVWAPVRDAAKLEGVTPHDLRHTAATALLESGMSIMRVSQILGHSTPTTTMGIYAHVVDTRSDQVAAAYRDAVAVVGQ